MKEFLTILIVGSLFIWLAYATLDAAIDKEMAFDDAIIESYRWEK